jgi:hypothetical protein
LVQRRLFPELFSQSGSGLIKFQPGNEALGVRHLRVRPRGGGAPGPMPGVRRPEGAVQAPGPTATGGPLWKLRRFSRSTRSSSLSPRRCSPRPSGRSACTGRRGRASSRRGRSSARCSDWWPRRWRWQRDFSTGGRITRRT